MEANISLQYKQGKLKYFSNISEKLDGKGSIKTIFGLGLKRNFAF